MFQFHNDHTDNTEQWIQSNYKTKINMVREESREK